ncbi:MAG: hypothetical protein LUI01_00855 [Firmicutes bacterium]|nr:hypothetical protein [Bacillota bacterium]
MKLTFLIPSFYQKLKFDPDKASVTAYLIASIRWSPETRGLFVGVPSSDVSHV